MTPGNDSCGGDHRRDCNNGLESWIYGWSAAAAQKVVNKCAEVSKGPNLTGTGYKYPCGGKAGRSLEPSCVLCWESWSPDVVIKGDLATTGQLLNWRALKCL